MRRRKARITFYVTECKRCKCELTTSSRSILGLDKLKEKYGSICRECMSEDERQEMLDAMGSGILKTA